MTTEAPHRTRLAVDIGGTFTDVVLEKQGILASSKVLTTPRRPAEGFMAGVAEVLEATGTKPAEVELIIHGTTLATNALIERRGARTALIVTEGHRDTLAIGYENRFAQYDINADRAPPLVPREYRWPVPERIDWQGHVRQPLDEAAVELVAARIAQHGIESIAIGLLHAYANPRHEERIAEIIRHHLPELPISLSCAVCPEIREYERQSTTCANSYIQPLMSRYLRDLQARLDGRGFACACLLMTSGGSLVTIDTACAFPIRLVESGPAGGAILASHMARQLGEDRVLSFDMGGTTAKICLIDDGEPLLSRAFEVARSHRFMKGSGLPLKIPVVEMVEIGAGGGSIAYVDALNRVHVGPQSAGASPGPACYGAGGNRPTVTDANLLMGRLDAERFAGGQLQLHPENARRALADDIGGPLALDTRDAAIGVAEIVEENMASAARVHASERGKEIAGRTMIVFGGAAPLHAARLAQKLDIRRVIVPNLAGVGSAVGFLLAPIAYEVVRSRYLRLASFDASVVNSVFATMHSEATKVVTAAVPDADRQETRFAFARYVGQGHEIKIPIPVRELTSTDAATIRDAFETEYRSLFARAVPGLDVEVLTWSLTISVAQDYQRRQAPVGDQPPGAVPSAQTHREVWFAGSDHSVSTACFAREQLAPDVVLDGPAIITEAQTSSVIPAGFSVSRNATGDLVIEGRDPATQVTAEQGGLQGIAMQVAWDRLIATVEEQAQAIIRTAFSTTVREAGDLSAGVFDLDGRMLAQAVTGTPGHVNAMAASVGCFLERIPSTEMCVGDVYLTNGPWLGTGHLFDFTVLTPTFMDGRLVAFFASTVHVVDIGGRGFGPDAGQIFEEGLCIPIMPLFKGGEANQSLIEIVRANVREPDQVIGDLYSLAASNEVGGRRLVEMMCEFDLADLGTIGQAIIDISRQAMLDAIGKLPPGTYQAAMTVDGYDKPVELRARMDIDSTGITVDFAGTSPVSSFGINVPLTYSQAYASFGIRCVVGPEIPNNAGSLATIRIMAPAGCILNAERPCAVAVRHVIGQMLPDVVLGCLDQVLPGSVPAEGSSSLWNPMLSGGHGMLGGQESTQGSEFSITIFHSGGTGARPGKHGLSATAFPSGVRSTPVEITESIAPLIFRRKELRPDSGGAGRFEGGWGQVIEIEHADGEPFAVFALFDRIDYPARGRAGGTNGAPGRIALASGAVLRSKGKQIVPAGDRLILELPGGGGLGQPETGDEPIRR